MRERSGTGTGLGQPSLALGQLVLLWVQASFSWFRRLLRRALRRTLREEQTTNESGRRETRDAAGLETIDDHL